MFFAILKKLPVFVVPAAILIATWFTVPYIAALTPARQELVVVAPYLVTALGMFLTLHFHRGRPFLALLVLILFYWVSRTFLGEQPDLTLNRYFLACTILIPANMALFTLMRERGIFSMAGRLRLVFIAIQTGGVLWLFNHHFYSVQPHLVRSFVKLHFFENILIPQPALLLGAISFVCVAALAVLRQTPVDSGMLGALTAFFIASNCLKTPDIHVAYCTAAALIIILSVLQDSYNMAFRDDLTGIPSRRALNESLHGLGRRYTIAMLDVDHFKRFNDTYGHDVGDQVLKMVAQQMLDVGGGGRAYRYGGEEFTILFSGKRMSDALPHLEQVRLNIAGYRMALRADERPKKNRQGKSQRSGSSRRDESAHVSVTVSIGMAESSDELATPAEVIKASDKALYKAKNKGRNQVCR